MNSVSPTVAMQPQAQFATGSNPRSVSIGDLNGDGKPDLALANLLDNTVSVLLNTTSPGETVASYSGQSTFATGSAPYSVSIGDFNGDGKPDLAVANGGSNTVSVLLNTTAPGETVASYSGHSTFATGSAPYSVSIGDFNGDGKPDLAISNSSSDTVSVLLNTTAPGATVVSYSGQATFSTGSSPASVSIGDLNGDGKPDLAIANGGSNTVSVLLNTTAPGATVASYSSQSTFATGSYPSSVSIGDLNDDGNLDLAVTNAYSDTVRVLLNTTAPGATVASYSGQSIFATGSHPISVSIGDLNGDGKPDLAVANDYSDTVSVLLNTTAPGATVASYSGQSTFSTGSSPHSVSLGDLNGDGKPDLAIANQNSISVLLNATAVSNSLTVSSATGTTFEQSVGGSQALTTLTISSGPTTIGGGSITTKAAQIYTGDVTLSADTTLLSGSGSITMSSVTDGALSYNLILGNNTQTGSVTFSGAVTVNTLTTFASTSAIAFNGGGTIDTATAFLNTGMVTLGNDNSDSITFTGGLTITAASSIVIQGTLATTNTTMTLGDSDTGITSNGGFSSPATLNAGTASIFLAGNITGSGSNNPVKPITSGAGSTLITGTNSAEIQVPSGVVTIANTADQLGGYRVSGGTLRGGLGFKVGYIYAYTGTSTVAPGVNGPGMMHTSVALSIGSANTLQIGLDGTSTTQYDNIEVCINAAVTLTNPTLSLSSSFTPTDGTVFTIIHNVSLTAVSGTFKGLAEGAIISANNQNYRISYVGGTGNDVTLTVVPAGTDDIVVTVSSNIVVLSLSTKGVTITDLHTGYSAAANTLTITATNIGGTISSIASGITVNSKAGVITVNLTTIPSFAGISVVGDSGIDSITIGTGGINLAAITKGSANQDFTIDTQGGNTDFVKIGNAIVTKGSGVVLITTLGVGSTKGIQLGASVTSSAGSGSQGFAGAVTLVVNTMLSSGTGGISFSSTIDGAKRLSLSTTGLVSLAGNVGDITPLRGVVVSKAAGVDIQSGFILNGSGTATGVSGLTIAAGVNNVYLSGKATQTISHFSGSGIAFLGGSTGSSLTGVVSTANAIGLSVAAGAYTGTVISACSFDKNTNIGVSLTGATGLQLGTVELANSISNNVNWGVYATGTLTGTVIRNNDIVGNGRFGVYLKRAAALQLGGTVTGDGNRIINATVWKAYSDGICATGLCAGTLVQGNAIQSNRGSGVMLIAARGITIGGTGIGAGNTISANGQFGVNASGICTGSVVLGNLVSGNAKGSYYSKNASGITIISPPG